MGLQAERQINPKTTFDAWYGLRTGSNFPRNKSFAKGRFVTAFPSRASIWACTEDGSKLWVAISDEQPRMNRAEQPILFLANVRVKYRKNIVWKKYFSTLYKALQSHDVAGLSTFRLSLQRVSHALICFCKINGPSQIKMPTIETINNFHFKECQLISLTEHARLIYFKLIALNRFLSIELNDFNLNFYKYDVCEQ